MLYIRVAWRVLLTQRWCCCRRCKDERHRQAFPASNSFSHVSPLRCLTLHRCNADRLFRASQKIRLGCPLVSPDISHMDDRRGILLHAHRIGLLIAKIRHANERTVLPNVRYSPEADIGKRQNVLPITSC